VLEDFGDRLGRAWCETAEEDGNRAALLRHLKANTCIPLASWPSTRHRDGRAM
jgi:hypothetical protein